MVSVKDCTAIRAVFGHCCDVAAGAMMLSVIVLSAQQQKSGIDESEC